MRTLVVHSMSKVENLTGLLAVRKVITGFRKSYMNVSGSEDRETSLKAVGSHSHLSSDLPKVNCGRRFPTQVCGKDFPKQVRGKDFPTDVCRNCILSIILPPALELHL